jgi:HK97 gp10 family phage protein
VRVGNRRISKNALAALTQVPEVKKQVQAKARRIRDEARQLAPIQTGALRRSITVVNHYDPATKTVEYRVGWNPAIAFYGPMIEFGTEDTAAQPHLRPAALKVQGR